MKIPKRAATIIAHIRRLQGRRTAVLEGLLRPDGFLKGSLSLVYRTCGKPNCHCAQRPGHPVWVLATRQNGRPRRQVVRKADVEEARKQVSEYQQFREALRQLRAINKEEKQLLKGLLEKRHIPYE